MRIFISLLILAMASCFNGHAQEETLEKILNEQNFNVSELSISCPNSPWLSEHVSVLNPYENADSYIDLNSISPRFLTVDKSEINSELIKSKSLFFESYAVMIATQDGYSFHIADYYDGTRVVTCLNGGMKGLQCIAVNGIKVAECTNVEWHKSYFLHRYPTGKIYSYPNRQNIELY